VTLPLRLLLRLRQTQNAASSPSSHIHRASSLSYRQSSLETPVMAFKIPEAVRC
jgi:hypothetical protein